MVWSLVIYCLHIVQWFKLCSLILIVQFGTVKWFQALLSNTNDSTWVSCWVGLLRVMIYVTLCRWSTKQTIPLSVLAGNQTKGLDSRSRRDRKWIRERERSWTKELTEVSWRRVTRVAVDTGQQKWAVSMSESSTSEGRPVKMGWHS